MPGPYRDLIQRFVRRRRALGIAQVALDERLGVASGLVSKWECGDRIPSLFMLQVWADGLGYTFQVVPTPRARRVGQGEQLEFHFTFPKRRQSRRARRRRRTKRRKPKKIEGRLVAVAA